MRIKPAPQLDNDICPGIGAEDRAIRDFLRNTVINILAFSLILAALCIAGNDQLEDEQKSAEALSNAPHIAALDAAERRHEEIILSAAGNEMPADTKFGK